MLIAMAGMPFSLGWMLAGSEGGLWSLILVAVLHLLAPNLPPAWVMRLHRAMPLDYRFAAGLHHELSRIARKAGLQWQPELYRIASPALNAFAVGEDGGSAIAVTEGLLRRLSHRELVAVLAHEVSHIRNLDTRSLALSEIFRQVTSAFALLGQTLLILLSLLLAMGEDQVMLYWPAVMLLLFSPVISGLLQLAFSRTREFQADLDAAALTGDPEGLASALYKLNTGARGFLGQLLHPRGAEGRDWLRSHPDSKERIRRLLELVRPVRSYQSANRVGYNSPVFGVPAPYQGLMPREMDFNWRRSQW
ncbi:MAG: M48 family metalloprotease [Magnetococcales bacterium]|nr:M48 family metalloprotease [Magnetococcales bacterium]